MISQRKSNDDAQGLVPAQVLVLLHNDWLIIRAFKYNKHIEDPYENE